MFRKPLLNNGFSSPTHSSRNDLFAGLTGGFASVYRSLILSLRMCFGELPFAQMALAASFVNMGVLSVYRCSRCWQAQRAPSS